MTGETLADLACFSYLAAADVLGVRELPLPNSGAEITRRRRSVAGDGPLVAAFAGGLGLSTCLVANGVGEDTAGEFVREYLRRNGVATRLGPTRETPYALILEDDLANREWFVHLAAVRQDLDEIDFEPLRDARYVYVDLYPVIEEHAARCLGGRRSGSLFVNLGGGWPGAAAVSALRAAGPAVVQTSSETTEESPAHLARRIAAELGAATAVVTRGADGAIMWHNSRLTPVPAPAVAATTGHGVGAAFAAAMVSALARGADPEGAAAAGCTFASLHCAEGRERYTPDDLSAFEARKENE